VLSDLTGVPDILARVKPIFRSLVRGRRHEPKVAELKPSVRVVVTAYLLVLIPALAFMIGSIVISAPRTFATAYDSFWLQLDRLHGSHGWAELGVGAFRIAALVMPLAAISLSVSRSARMTLRGVGRWSHGSPMRRTAAVTGLAALLGAIAFTWWPDGDYQPIRPGERGTIGEAIRAVPAIPSGRPSFTPERAAEFGSVPTVRERNASAGARHDAAEPINGADPAGGGDEPVPGEDVTGGDDPADGTYPYPAGEDPGSSADPGASPTPSPTGGSTPAPAGTTEPDSGTATPSPTATDTPTATPTPTSTPAASTTPTASTSPTASATPSPDATALTSPSPLPDTQALETQPTPLPTP